MRVIVPYTHIEPGVLEAIREGGYEPELFDVSEDNFAYWELLCVVWKDGEDAAIIEHDIKVRLDTLRGFDLCRKPLCIAKYPYLNGVFAGLGCTRWRSSLMKAAPDLMLEVGELSNYTHCAKHWCTLAEHIGARFRANNIAITHEHLQVEHLGDQWASHGCVPRDWAG